MDSLRTDLATAHFSKQGYIFKTGKVTVKIGAFDYGSNLSQYFLPVPKELFTKNFDGSRGGRNECKQHTHGGGFPRAILTQESIHIPLLYFKRDVVNRRDRFKSFGKRCYADDWHSGFNFAVPIDIRLKVDISQQNKL